MQRTRALWSLTRWKVAVCLTPDRPTTRTASPARRPARNARDRRTPAGDWRGPRSAWATNDRPRSTCRGAIRAAGRRSNGRCRIRRRTPAHRRAVRAAPELLPQGIWGPDTLWYAVAFQSPTIFAEGLRPSDLPHTLAHSRAMQVSRFEQDTTIQGFQGAERASVPRTLNSRNPGRGRRCRPGGRPDDWRHQHVEGRPRSDRIGTLRHSGEAISTTLHSLLSPAATTDTVI